MAKILCLIDSFKGTLTSLELGSIAKDVLGRKGHDVEYIPISDGGDGFLDSIKHITKLKSKTIKVKDPNGNIISANYLIDHEQQKAYIEMAQSSGINLIDITKSSIFNRSTYGLGELIQTAVNDGAKTVYIGLGGSATNDGGAGMLEALGVKFFDSNHHVIKHIKPSDFSAIESIDTNHIEERFKDIEFVVFSDVDNPLLGSYGASVVFGPQKGLNIDDIKRADLLMNHYATKLEEVFNKRMHHQKGSGAAGGVGFALQMAFNATYRLGIDEILNMIDVTIDYDYIITGEGKIDHQSLSGKVIVGVIKKFKDSNIILVCGKNELQKSDLEGLNIYAVFDIIGNLNVSLTESLQEPKKYFKQLMELISHTI